MAADVLAELAALDCLPDRYLILEVSADLAERQRARLAQLPAALARRVQWLERWPERAMRGVVLANEVLDAMPVERFVLRDAPVNACGAGRGERRSRDSSGAKLPPARSSRTPWRASSTRCRRRCPTVMCPRSAWRFSRGSRVSPRNSRKAWRC